VPVFWIGTCSASWGGPWLFSGGGTATTHFDQQLSHPLKCLVIFNLLGQPGVAPGQEGEQRPDAMPCVFLMAVQFFGDHIASEVRVGN
jgi:hypothetical protein